MGIQRRIYILVTYGEFISLKWHLVIVRYSSGLSGHGSKPS